MPGMSLKAYAATTSVSYIERHWDDTQVVSESKNQNCTVYNMTYASDITTTLNGWYYFDGVMAIDERLNVPAGGVANIIIKDGITLLCRKGINVPAGATLNIYGQSEGTGILCCEVSSGEHAAIGSNNEAGDCGTVNIYGCNVQATGGKYGAGIGGGDQCKGGNISIYGGDITTTGGFGGPGIGGDEGSASNPGVISISGGTVTATGGTNFGAGIGGGDQQEGGTINITGGDITARGGKGAAGIGGGGKRGAGNTPLMAERSKQQAERTTKKTTQPSVAARA